MHYQFLGTAYLPEGCLHESNPHPGLVRALDLARQTIQSPAGLKVFAEILHPLTYTQVSEHLDASLTSEYFPQICLHRDLENYWCHNHRFNQTPNKIWLLAEVSTHFFTRDPHSNIIYLTYLRFKIVDALVAAWDAGNEIILNRNLVEVTVCILHELAHWIRWTKFKDTTTPPKLSFGNFGTDRGKYAGEVGWWLEYKLFGGPLRGARSIDNKVKRSENSSKNLYLHYICSSLTILSLNLVSMSTAGCQTKTSSISAMVRTFFQFYENGSQERLKIPLLQIFSPFLFVSSRRSPIHALEQAKCAVGTQKTGICVVQDQTRTHDRR